MIYFTSDTHFGHKNIIEYCGRPFRTVAGMTEALVHRWNAQVQPNDTIYHLGDFAMCLKSPVVADILARLNGTKILIAGNHDDHWTKTKWRRLGFDEVHDWLETKLDGTTIAMVHDPVKFALAGRNDIGICGHVHAMWKTFQFKELPVINVGVDVWAYRPVSLEVLRETANVAN